ncbi:FHA domain-containing protein [Georgenia sp. 10Sc9-8]|uniref:FHA domain-containing protein n=1 Tax=Georgenia halotolerans TaxID=3028317 RepID=A0ABT5TZ13_9MICO|nr:FHA domain-containing protein [Georgenia halotolerans]
MSELIVTLLRLGYLVLLWVFVLAAIGVLRHDVFGTRVTSRDRPAAPARGGGRPRRPGPATRLVVTAGPLAGTTLPLGGSPVLVGRSPGCTLVLDDDYSSNRHARFFPQDGAWWLEDLGSTNGTFLGDERVTGPVQVRAGVPVRIGQTVIELRR